MWRSNGGCNTMGTASTMASIVETMGLALTGNAAIPAVDARRRDSEPPGRGRSLVKVGGRPGIPFRVELTSVERDVNDTNKRWTDGTTRSSSAPPASGP